MFVLPRVFDRVAGLGCALVLIFAPAFVSLAADKLWTGAISTNWFEADNWEPPGVPEASDAAYLSKTGLVYLASDVVIASLNLRAPSLELTVDGPGNLTVTNLNWTNGVLKGSGTCTVPAAGLLRVRAGVNRANLQRELVSFGTIEQSGSLSLGAVLENRGTYEISGRYTDIVGDPLRALLRNIGTFLKSSEMFTNVIGVPFENIGEMRVLGGGLQLLEYHTNTGNVEISDPGVLELRKSGFIAPSCSLLGTGRLRFFGFTGAPPSTVLTTNPIHPRVETARVGPYMAEVGPTLNFGSSVLLRECFFDGDVITGNGTVTITNFIWTNGMVSGTGALVIPSNGTCKITGFYSVKRLDRTTVLNYGDIEWSHSTEILPSSFPPTNNSTLINRGTFRAMAYGSWFRPIINEGRFIRSVSPSWTINLVTNSGFVQVESGLSATYVQTAGETYVNTDAWLSGLTILGGILRGSGTVSGGNSPCTPALVNLGGEISPGNPLGVLTVSGTFAEYMNGKITIEIGGTRPGIDFDQIRVLRGVGLQGLLKVVLTNGFTPQLGDRFEIVTHTNALVCTNTVQNFSRISGTDLGDGLVLLPEYSPTNLVLVVTNAPANNFYVIRNPADRTRHHIRFYGSPGTNYLLQASTTLTDWIDVVRSEEPIDFIDYMNLQADSWRYPYRFFRVRWGK
jgi:hypothetical protein